MAKIKHIAIVSLDTERLAKFYEEVFEMKVLHRSSGGAVYLTDGYINVALLPNKAEGKASGINHFGFQIDDQEKIAERMQAFSLARPAKRPANRPYAETRGTDPDGNNFDLSVHGFDHVEYAGDREKKEREKVGA